MVLFVVSMLALAAAMLPRGRMGVYMGVVMLLMLLVSCHEAFLDRRYCKSAREYPN